jgi:hypothetical protein
MPPPSSTDAAWAAAGCLGAATLLAAVGCAAPELPSAEVQGKVTAGNKPLPGVTVIFYPDSEGAQLPVSTATTNAAGEYALTMPNGKPGAVVGKHRVVVSWPAPERDLDKPPPPPPTPRIPVEYTVASQTPLVVEVKEGERQTINLNVQLP